MSEIVITPIGKRDSARWKELWRGYLDFYETSLPEAIYRHTLARILAAESPIHAFGARFGDKAAPLVGIAHYLFHAHAWTLCEVCYLQDLFVEERSRGRGVGRKLIEAVAAAARERGSPRLYWTTQERNTAARALYEQIAAFNGFIRYDYPLD